MATLKPVIAVESGSGAASKASLRELWLFREVLWAFVVRQIRVKYKQTAIGVIWVILQPVIAAVLITLFIGRLVRVSNEGVPYLMFALAGMVAWTFFSGAAGSAMESLIADQTMLRKVYFPREILPLAAVAAALVDLVPGLGVLVGVTISHGGSPAPAWLLLPVPIALLVISATLLGLWLAGLNVYYRDVRYALPFVLQLGLFASPVIYPLSAVPAAWRTEYAILNPVAAAIDGLRRIILHGLSPDPVITVGAFLWASLLLCLGYFVFKRLERGFADRV